MHPLLRVLLILFAFSTTFAEESGEGPPSYVESSAPIVIRNNASVSVDISCHHVCPDSDEPLDAARTPRSTRGVKPSDHWSINFPAGLEDPLYCTFRIALRSWNCDDRWLIREACVWEDSWAVVRSGHAVLNPEVADPGCPLCEDRNSIGKAICVWTIQNDGIYAQEWDADTQKDQFTLKHAWREDSPYFYDPTSPFRFSVTNHFNHTVKIQCDVVSEPVFLQGLTTSGPSPKWEYEIDPVMDADSTYFPWTCDFEVLGTELRRGGVAIWSPQPEVNTWIRTPDCIDCAWKLDIAGLWLDDRSCYMNRPVWVKEHSWDSVLNASAADDMEWNPLYYRLKKSSDSRFV